MEIPHGFSQEVKFDDLMMPHPSTVEGKIQANEKRSLMAAEWAAAEGLADLLPLEDDAGYRNIMKIAAE